MGISCQECDFDICNVSMCNIYVWELLPRDVLGLAIAASQNFLLTEYNLEVIFWYRELGCNGREADDAGERGRMGD